MARLECEIDDTILNNLSEYCRRTKIQSTDRAIEDAIKLFLSKPLTTREAAIVADVHPSTILRWEKADKLRAVRPPLSGRRMVRRFKLERVERTLSWEEYVRKNRKRMVLRLDADRIRMGHSIKACRRRLGLDLREAARKAGDTVTRLKNIERGKYRLQKRTIVKYAKAWDVSIDNLLKPEVPDLQNREARYEFWIPLNKTWLLDEKDWKIVWLLREHAKPTEIAKRIRLSLSSTSRRIRKIKGITDNINH